MSEIILNYTSGTTEERIAEWQNPDYAWDKNDANYATSYSGVFLPCALLVGQNHDNIITSGNISKVEIGIKGVVSAAASPHLYARFNGATDSVLFHINCLQTSEQTLWLDITNDANAPTPWNWNAINNLDMYLKAVPPFMPVFFYVNQFYIKVNYTEGAEGWQGKINNVEPIKINNISVEDIIDVI